MTELLAYFWPSLAGLVVLGFATGWGTRRVEPTPRAGWLALTGAILCVVLGTVISSRGMLAGRAAFALESALWHVGFFAAGCVVGSLLGSILRSRSSRPGIPPESA